MEYWPPLSVVVVVVAGWVTTVAPAIGLAAASVTVPVTVPGSGVNDAFAVVVWPLATVTGWVAV
jgi:hypothetical protein